MANAMSLPPLKDIYLDEPSDDEQEISQKYKEIKKDYGSLKEHFLFRKDQYDITVGHMKDSITKHETL